MAELGERAVAEFDYDVYMLHPDDLLEYEGIGIRVQAEEDLPAAVAEYLPATEATLRSPAPARRTWGSRAGWPATWRGWPPSRSGSAARSAWPDGSPRRFPRLSLILGIEPTLVLMLEDPGLLRRFEEFFLEYNDRVARLQLEAGADALWLGDCVATSHFISPAQYEEHAAGFAAASARRIREAGGIVFYHGNEKSIPHLSIMAGLGFDAINIGEGVDIGEVKRAIGGQVCIMGNLDPLHDLQPRSSQEVEKVVQGIVEKAKPGGGYLFCTGEGVPHNTPVENLRAMHRAVRNYGKVLTFRRRRELLEYLVLIRRFEERVKVLYNQGVVVGAIHLCIGQEAVATGVCRALRDEDTVFSTHRGHGHAIAKSGEVERIMAELMGRDTGLSRGHGGSMHLFEPEKGLMGGNGIVGGGIPLSLGGAFTRPVPGERPGLGRLLQRRGREPGHLRGVPEPGRALEAARPVGLREQPVRRHHAGGALHGGRATWPAGPGPTGCEAQKADGNDVEAVYAAASAAVAALRRGQGPRLLECETYRVEPHCGIIPDERAPGERELWNPRDPVSLYAGRLQAAGVVSRADLEALERVVRERLDRAAEFGSRSPWPDPKAEPHRTWVLQ